MDIVALIGLAASVVTLVGAYCSVRAWRRRPEQAHLQQLNEPVELADHDRQDACSGDREFRNAISKAVFSAAESVGFSDLQLTERLADRIAWRLEKTTHEATQPRGTEDLVPSYYVDSDLLGINVRRLVEGLAQAVTVDGAPDVSQSDEAAAIADVASALGADKAPDVRKQKERAVGQKDVSVPGLYTRLTELVPSEFREFRGELSDFVKDELKNPFRREKARTVVISETLHLALMIGKWPIFAFKRRRRVTSRHGSGSA